MKAQNNGHRFEPTKEQEICIYKSVDRAISFLNSPEHHILDEDLQERVRSVEREIAIAAFIDNVNLRGRIIEYLVTESGDLYYTATDIKTKVLFLSSNPKGYNIDKLLSFLAEDQSVYLVFIVAIDKNEQIKTRLCSMYNRQLLSSTRIISHWAGQNSRGVTQYLGKALEDAEQAYHFLDTCLSD